MKILLIGCCCRINKDGMGMKRSEKNLTCRNADFFRRLGSQETVVGLV